MKKKVILSLIISATLLILTPKISLAACTKVASNQTSCNGTQSVACSQVLPGGGKIDRWCCDDQTSCDAVKGSVQQQISNQLAKPATSEINGTCGVNGIDTAIGCIDVLGSQSQFLGEILRWAVGVGGGIAFLLIVYAGFMIMTSTGDPERLKAGQELLTSAISGLILLIFAIFVLRFIGVDILGLNKFGFGQ